MAPSGLARKLGIRAGMKVALQGAPADFIALPGDLPEGAKLIETAGGEADCVVAFVRSKSEVKKMARGAIRAAGDDGLLWFAYPKKSGPLPSDLSRDSGWEPLREAGFDSVAQISIDDTWTGFRFRAKERIGKRAG